MLEEFINKHKNLLELERNEEINRSKFLSESSPKTLEEKNLCIRKLTISNIFTGLYGRTIIEFESKLNKESKRVFSQGDIIGVYSDSSKSAVNKTIATGLFYKLDKESIQIAVDNNFDNEIDFLKDLDSGTYRLVKLSSEITYSRLKSGLKYLEKRKNPLCGDYLIDLLLGSLPLSITKALKEINFINANLNTSQQDAVSFALSRPDVAVIHGPPGTGKTTVAVEIINQILESRVGERTPKILVCTPSNIALDNLAEKLLKSQRERRKEKLKSKSNKLNALRLGHSVRVMPHLSEISLDYKLSCCDQAELIAQVRSQIDSTLRQSWKASDKIKPSRKGELSDLRKELRERELKAVREVLGSSHVILSTLTGLRSNKSLPLNEIEFDVVLIDEASQAIEAACWLAIPRGKKLIIAGDHKQLPPTVLSEEASKQGLGLSLMERLLDLYPGCEISRMLSYQYRMNEDIMRWSSDIFYRSELIADVSVAKHELKDIFKPLDPDACSIGPLTFIDTSGCELYELNAVQEDSKANLGEAQLTAVYIQQLVCRFNLEPHHIGVITPYSRQVQLIKTEMKNRIKEDEKFNFEQIEVSTVDGFQGREKEIIITNLVRSNQTGTIGFLAEHRRLNVALTRAKRHLCIIGDSSTIEQSKDQILISLIEYWNRFAEVRSAHDYIYEYNITAGDCVKSKSNVKVSEQKKISQQPKPVPNLELEKKYCDQLREFHRSERAKLEFPSNLTPKIRAALHELAESLHLHHESVGEGKNRKLIVHKIDFNKNVTKCENGEEINSVSSKVIEPIESSEIDVITNPFKLHEVDSFDRKSEIVNQCTPSCQNIAQEETVVNCEENLLDLIKAKILNSADNKEKTSSTTKKITKKPKKKSNRSDSAKETTKTDIPEDFEEMIEHFQSLDKFCNHPEKCKAPVSVLGFNCQFCKKRFCVSHMQPEVHCCPMPNRAAWRHAESNNRQVSEKNKIKHVQLSRVINNKLNDLSTNRMPKKKSD